MGRRRGLEKWGYATSAAVSLVIAKPALAEELTCAIHDPDPDCAPRDAKKHVPASFSPVVELTLGPSFLDPKGRTVRGSWYLDTEKSFSYSGNLIHHDLDWVNFGMRVTFAISTMSYVGFELGLGPGASSVWVINPQETKLVPSDGAAGILGYGGGLITGFRLPLGHLSLRAETLFGGQGVLAATNAANGVARSESLVVQSWRIEPRAFLDIWATPTVTMSGFVGINALHSGDHVGGLAIGLHANRFDGTFLW
jgi:hypothetical protein